MSLSDEEIEALGIEDPGCPECGRHGGNHYKPCLVGADEDRADAAANRLEGILDEEAKRNLPVRYVDQAMFTAEGFSQQEEKAPNVILLSATPDPLGAIAAASMMYEGRVVR